MIIDQLEVRIDGKLSVSKETARACLVLLNAYLNNTDDQLIYKELNNGCVEMYLWSDRNSTEGD